MHPKNRSKSYEKLEVPDLQTEIKALMKIRARQLKGEKFEDIIKENQKLKVDKENLQYQVESYKRGTKKTTLAFESYENQIKDLQVSTPHNS